MLDDQDSEFILGIFLMEAWDTVAAVEEGARRLASGEPVSTGVLDPLVVVAHRLKGAAALHGYPIVSAVALAMEDLLESLLEAPAADKPHRVEVLGEVVATVKRMLETIGDDGREDVDAVVSLRSRHPELFAPPEAPEPSPEAQVQSPEPAPAATFEPVTMTPHVVEERLAVTLDEPAGVSNTPAGVPVATSAAPQAPLVQLPGAQLPGAPLPAVPPPAAPLDEAVADALLRELDRFFAEQAESVPYFAPEAAEHLDVMTRSLLALEQPDSRPQEEVASLFRAVHTLKGAAYTVGCAPVGDIAHRIEDILDAVRDGRLRLSTAVIEAVFGGVDALRLLVGSARVASDSVRTVVQRTLDTLDGLRPAPAPLDALPVLELVAEPSPIPKPSPIQEATLPQREELVPAAPPAPRPRFVPPVAEVGERRGRESHEARPSIRVNLDRLDSLLNLVGELVIARSRLDQRFTQIERVNELLAFSRGRITQTVRDFEEKHRYTQLPPAVPTPGETADEGGHGPGDVSASEPLSKLFAELEFDRYDDFNIFARSVDEISADVSEIQAELAGLIQSVGEDTAHVQRLTQSLRSEVTRARMVPIGRLFARFTRPSREAARAAGKSVVLQLSGEAVEIDNAVIEQVADPLLHLVRNAIDHGIETDEERRAAGKPALATVSLSAFHQGSFVHIQVADDGRGMDPVLLRQQAVLKGFLSPEAAAALGDREALALVFTPGFSTAGEVTATSGRGVGMDVVRTNVSRLHGEIDIQSEPGSGTRITIKLPLTIVIFDALLVRAGGETFAVPMHAIRTILQVRPIDIDRSGERERIMVEDEAVELIRLDQVLALPAGAPATRQPVLVFRSGVRPFAVAVDELLGKEDVVIKSLGGLLERIGPYAGATVSGTGRVILLVDPSRLMEAAEAARHAGRAATAAGARGVAQRRAGTQARRILLVDDSISVRRFVGQMLEKAGFEVLTANDGGEAQRRLGEVSPDAPIDALITDLEMPRVSGYELIEDLRARPSTRALPIVVLTTRAGAKHVNLARRLGIAHYVTKPVDEEAFVRLIRSVTARSAETERAESRS
jgi:chemosensory pili system protein ChpA (sensor histidine kinase/response regulator)